MPDCSDDMNREIYALIAITVCGGAVVMLFDIFRAVRAAGKSNAFLTAAEDIAFWIISIYMVSKCLWVFNNGELRFFEAAGFVIGAVLYILLLQKIILTVFTVIFKNIFKFIHLICQILLTPPRFLYKILLVPLYVRVKRLISKSNSHAQGGI